MTEPAESETKNEAEHKIDISKNLNEMLDFERQIFLDIIEKDGLVICAKGLNVDTVVINLMQVYCDPGNLVIVINSSDYEEQYYLQKLKSENVFSSTYQVNQNQREELYLNGGVHFVTTRILVVDLLKKRIPVDRITGIIVLRAHSILESCQEAFVLRLYRQQNKTGFIKAFSNCAQSFTIGFGHVERLMRTLFVKELFLWPRFHSIVLQDLKKYAPVVIELHVPVSKTIKDAQTCILDLMNNTVKEMKSINRLIDMQEITTENCVTKKFHKILQAQLNPIWYQLSSKTKQLVADLKTLRYLISTMIHNDSVTFYSVVSSYMTREYAMSTSWVLQDSAEHLYGLVKSLVYKGNPLNKELHPQFSPKWEALIEILQIDIPADVKMLREKHNIDEKIKVLILCHDTKTCFQLNQILTFGPQKYLFLMALKHRVPFVKLSHEFVENIDTSLQNKTEKNEIEIKMSDILSLYTDVPNKKQKLDEQVTATSSDLNAFLEDLDDDKFDEGMKNTYMLKMSQAFHQSVQSTTKGVKTDSDNVADKSQNMSQYSFEPFPEFNELNLTSFENDDPLILIQTFKNNACALSLKKTLMDMQPNYIILYHSDMTAIRQIEVYEAKNKRMKPLKVYFLLHSDTVEEQSYLTMLRREKQAFELLIETKAKMVVPDYQDGKTDDCFSLQRELRPVPEKNTRKAGGQASAEQPAVTPRVIVDMREFRSELPSLIHRRGIEIEPLTITIGDYILTPNICVERKSISDLIQSLNSGRLYNQCVQMTRYYAQPMLLIEFDQSKPFVLQNNFGVTTNSSSKDLQNKLQLLTLHFPKLKLIWSPSPYASAQLFEEMKEGKEQPNIEYAMSVSNETDLESIEQKYNSVIYDFVLKLPGISTKNVDMFLRHGKSLDHIVELTEEQLKECVGNSNDANALYSFIHGAHKPEDAETKKGDKKGGKWKTRNKFRK